jgi:hypothetical protein
MKRFSIRFSDPSDSELAKQKAKSLEVTNKYEYKKGYLFSKA